MFHKSLVSRLFVLLFLTLSMPHSIVGQDDISDVELPGIANEFRDPAFEQYLDVQRLKQAWDRLDAAGLADAGVQLLEGERILLRSHEFLSADEVLRLAAQFAAASGDTVTLKRLANVAESSQRPKLAAHLFEIQKLGAPSRNAAATVNVDELTVEGLAHYKHLDRVIEKARLGGKAESLDMLAKLLPEFEMISQALRQDLLKQIRAAKKNLATGNPTLQKLSGVSRGYNSYQFVSWLPVPVQISFDNGKYMHLAQAGGQRGFVSPKTVIRVKVKAGIVQINQNVTPGAYFITVSPVSGRMFFVPL